MSGPSRAICRRAIRTGSWLQPKPGNESMVAPATRRLAQFGLGLCLVAAAGHSALANGTLKLRNAQAVALSFDVLAGWKDDDHAAAYAAFQKSCGAIRHGTKARRAARPVYGALFKVCERAAALGALDRDKARAFFEDNFKPVRLAASGQEQGFYTGYYEPVVQGSRVKTEEYNVPLCMRAGAYGEEKAEQGFRQSRPQQDRRWSAGRQGP